MQGVMKLLNSAPFRLKSTSLERDREWPFSSNWLAGNAQAHEGQGGSRLPRAVPCSRSRRVAARRGTRIGEHLKLALSVLDRAGALN